MIEGFGDRKGKKNQFIEGEQEVSSRARTGESRIDEEKMGRCVEK